MKKQLIFDSFGWGFILWLIGYLLGFILFFVVPPSILGWVIMPIGLLLTIFVLFSLVKSLTFRDYVIISIVWTAIAIVFDYVFLVKALNPADGYYKLDVYLYYAFTLILPLIIGWLKTRRSAR
jgi:hypothetical protein